MSFLAVILIIVSALLHIGWNYLLKYVRSDNVYMIKVYFLTSLIFCPAFYFFRDLLPLLKPLIPLLLITAFCKGLSNWSLVKSYKFGDYSFIYPLKNAMPLIFSCIWGLIIGKAAQVTPWAYGGFLLIFIGCLLMPLKNIKDFSLKNYLNRSFVFASVSSLATACYSVIDSDISNKFAAASDINDFCIAVFLIPVFYFSLAWFMIPFIWIDKKYFRDVKKIDRTKQEYRFIHILIHTLCMSIAYLLVLTAFIYAENVSYIVAFRQIGMPISFVIGYFVFKEKIYFGKAWGLIIIIAGLILTAVL